MEVRPLRDLGLGFSIWNSSTSFVFSLTIITSEPRFRTQQVCTIRGGFGISRSRMTRSRLASFWPTRGLIITLAGAGVAGATYRHFQTKHDSDTADTLNPQSFTPYTLISKQPVSSTSGIFTLRAPSNGNSGSVEEQKESDQVLQSIWQRGVWSVQAKQPQLQIARSYTPLPSTAFEQSLESSERPNPTDQQRTENQQLPSDLRFLIRAEKDGEVSNYLHSLPLSSTVGLRGPFLEFELPPDVREVIFIAGGTGIAPAMQVAHVLAQRPGARMHILWNTRRKDEIQGGEDDTSAGPLLKSETRRKLSDWDPWSKISRWSTFGLGHEEKHSSNGKVIQGKALPATKSAIVKELEALKKHFKSSPRDTEDRPGGLTIEYFADENHKFVKPKDVARQMRRVAEDEENFDMQPGTKLIMISGPDGFLELWAGKKIWLGGREVQGPLKGYFANFNLVSRGWKIWKL